MSSLSAWFENLFFGGGGKTGRSIVATVIGSGGKTSLIWHLAVSLAADSVADSVATGAVHGDGVPSRRKILVSPTTKMFVPPGEAKLYDRYYGGGKYDDPPGTFSSDPAPGITLVGRFNETNGKLESLPLPDLERLIPACDLVLLEGDGSRGLPLKAWTPDEPVVPSFTDLTIGILPLWPLGRPARKSIIHRLPLFLALSGAEAGEPLKPEHILALILGKGQNSGTAEPGGPSLPGLFAKAKGKKLLFFNQIEDREALKQAEELTGLLPSAFRAGLSGIIAGSVKEDWLVEL